MKKLYLRYLALVSILSGLVLLGLAYLRTVPAVNSPQIENPARVFILVDGKPYHLETLERLPANLLSQAGIQLSPGDQIILNGKPIAVDKLLPDLDSYSLQLRRAVQIILKDGAEEITFHTTAVTIGQALAQAGIRLYTADRLDPPAETLLQTSQAQAGQHKIEATLQRSRNITFLISERQLHFRTAAGSVGEALAEAGLSLQGLDYSQPAPEQAIPPDEKVRVTRVQESVILEQEPISFETELQPADDVELDTKKELQPGEFGLTARRVRVRVEDGQEVSRSVEAEWTAAQPKPRILGYGTKIVVRTLNTPDGPIEYWRAVQMYATSYSPCRIYKDHCDSYTALGATLQKGIVAMTNDWCRYTCGDSVYVPGYGVGTVADTGGGIPGRYWIDLGYSEEDYISWHDWVTVYFLTPVPANYQVVLP